MKKNNLPILQKVNQWVEIAEEDLNFAKLGFELSSSVSYRIIAFHAQQCAEKYLKAFLVFHKIDFPYTHSITTLIDLCSDIDKSFEQLRDAEILTSYATANRYPSEYRKLKKSDAQKSIKLAEKVRTFTRDKLIESGLKFSKRK
ncbi:MAG: HEPN domain-containing protein [Ignavibacterium sp.]|jgi:HEPN domain-containing protein|uniref:HEPN domain-containing protein n=1 Tax=Ignavibacterium sp. TaxID=2651167 RepID=UPI0032981590